MRDKVQIVDEKKEGISRTGGKWAYYFYGNKLDRCARIRPNLLEKIGKENVRQLVDAALDRYKPIDINTDPTDVLMGNFGFVPQFDVFVWVIKVPLSPVVIEDREDFRADTGLVLAMKAQDGQHRWTGSIKKD